MESGGKSRHKGAAGLETSPLTIRAAPASRSADLGQEHASRAVCPLPLGPSRSCLCEPGGQNLGRGPALYLKGKS